MTGFGEVFVPCAVYSANEESGKHWRWRARIRKEIRFVAANAGREALRAGTVSTCGDVPVQILVEPHELRKGRLVDVGNCSASAKSAIDGMRDAGVLVDDSPRYVKALTYLVGVRVGQQRYEGLRLIIREW
jgi:hypothetical protein